MTLPQIRSTVDVLDMTWEVDAVSHHFVRLSSPVPGPAVAALTLTHDEYFRLVEAAKIGAQIEDEKRDAAESTALSESIRALRDIAALDPSRPTANSAEKVARRSLERLEKILGIPGLAAEGHTYGPDEDFPGVNC